MKVDFNDDGTVTSEGIRHAAWIAPADDLYGETCTRTTHGVSGMTRWVLPRGMMCATFSPSQDEIVNANWTVLEDVWMPGSMLEYTITSLINGYMYDVQVRTKYQEEISPWSDTVVGTPIDVR